MYMNRLRVDDFCELFQSSGHNILLVDSDEDPSAAAALKLPGFKLDRQFAEKPEKVLATTRSWIVAGKGGKGSQTC